LGWSTHPFLALKAGDEARYRELLGEEGFQMAKRLDYKTWREQLVQEGRQEGRQEGAVLAMRAAVLSSLEERFAPVSEEWRRRVETIEAPSALDALLRRVITAADAEEARAALFQASS
jgi:predicted transposase YdaD